MKIHFREIIDSRAEPTLACDIIIDKITMSASVPSGKSLGKNEVSEKRDNDQSRYLGKGLIDSIRINQPIIQDALHNFDTQDQSIVDNILIQLQETHNIGGNFSLAVSLAYARFGAYFKKVPLYQYLGAPETFKHFPRIMVNILNGGQHAKNKLDCQEFMVVPLDNVPITEHVRYATEIFHELGKVLEKKGYGTYLGDEGGYASNIASTEDALKILTQLAQYYKIGIALDFAASVFFTRGYYFFEQNKYTKDEFINYIVGLTEQYPIMSVEDPLGETDWDSWQNLTRKIGDKVLLVGDDLFTTNKKILSRGVKKNIANAILIKPNQIGTLTQTLEAVEEAKSAGYKVIVSHRSGETTDTFIADLALGVNADYVKFGSMARGERTCKYNRLTAIYHALSY